MNAIYIKLLAQLGDFALKRISNQILLRSLEKQSEMDLINTASTIEEARRMLPIVAKKLRK
jgi:hypothetical protein